MSKKPNNGPLVRSNKHTYIRFINSSKIDPLYEFISEYREAVLFCVDYIWDLKLEWITKNIKNKDTGKNITHIWDREKDYLDCPGFISTTKIGYQGKLSARALKCAATQACGIVQAVANKREKNLFTKNYLESNNKTPGKTLLNRLNKGMTKPDCKEINCELNSICMDIQLSKDIQLNKDIDLNKTKYFEGFVQLKSIWTEEKISGYPRGYKIRIPFKTFERAKKWSEKGKLLNSILLNETCISLRYEIKRPEIKKEGKRVAIDQGISSLLMTTDESNNKRFIPDIHGHTFSGILEKLARKKRGSRAFQRACEHRKNFINHFIKQLDLNEIREVLLEEIININYGRNVSRKLKHFVNTLIRDSLIKLCEETGVLFTLVANEFNSQRCFACGWTRKANRKGKAFKCTRCGHCDDADHNAAQNILIRDTLFELPWGFRRLKLNLKGFYWTLDGLADANGQELVVPAVPSIEQNLLV